MSFRWLKRYLPRSLYGRAVLILVLPVVTVMLVVSIVFIQRYFEGVTRQMATSVGRDLRLVLESGDTVAQIARSRAARALDITVESVSESAVPAESGWDWKDLTGAWAVNELHRILPTLRTVDLHDNGVVKLYLDRPRLGLLRLTFDRTRLSASKPDQLLVNMVGFAIIMTLIAYLYLRNQLRPITRLAEAAEAFGRGQHLPYRPSGAIEVRAAGRAFVDMRARIERQIEQRTLLLSGVSHDLRTPLTRLKLGLSMLDDAEPAMEEDIAEMERLIDTFLAFVRGAHEGAPEPVDPVALVARAVEDAQRSGKPVTLIRREGAGEMLLRAPAIRRAVENLINNAVRYGSRAEVSVLLSDTALLVRVEDDGPGILEESREEVLKPFVRLDSARNQNRGSGVGLGLSIADDIARAHGGTLRLRRSAGLGGLCAEIAIGTHAQAPGAAE